MQDDVEGWLADETENMITANRGEITVSTKSERAALIAPYLAKTEFSEYQDLREPIVRISQDGSMGWLMAQVEVRGVRTFDDGRRVAIDSVWARIELYEKRSVRWLRVGNVSNQRP